MTMDKIVLQYTPKPQDYSNAVKMFLSNGRISNSIVRGFLSVLAFIMIASLLLNIGTANFRVAVYYLPLIILVVLFLLLPSMSGSSTVRKVSKQPQLLLPVTYEIDDEKILIMTELSETKLNWGVFNKTLETDQYYYLIYVTNKNMFQFLPKRIFASQAQEDDFRQLVEQKAGKIEDIQKGLKGWKLSLLVFIILMAGILFCGLALIVLSALSDYPL
jgi:hypothetical protein